MLSSDNYNCPWRQLKLTPEGHGDCGAVSEELQCPPRAPWRREGPRPAEPDEDPTGAKARARDFGGGYPAGGFWAFSPALRARWLAPSNSRMMEWCTSRSMAAIVVIGSLKIWSHWLKTRLELIRMLRRS